VSDLAPKHFVTRTLHIQDIKAPLLTLWHSYWYVSSTSAQSHWWIVLPEHPCAVLLVDRNFQGPVHCPIGGACTARDQAAVPFSWFPATMLSNVLNPWTLYP